MILFRLQDLILSSSARRDKLVLLGLISGLLLNLASWIALFLFFNGSTEYIILKYNIYFGISSFGSWPNIFWLPAIGLVVLLLNLWIGFYLYFKYRFLSYILSFSAMLVNLIILVAGFLLIYINL